MCEVCGEAYKCLYCSKTVNYSHSLCPECGADAEIVNTVKIRQVEEYIKDIGHRLCAIESIMKSLPHKTD